MKSNAFVNGYLEGYMSKQAGAIDVASSVPPLKGPASAVEGAKMGAGFGSIGKALAPEGGAIPPQKMVQDPTSQFRTAPAPMPAPKPAPAPAAPAPMPAPMPAPAPAPKPAPAPTAKPSFKDAMERLRVRSQQT